MHDRPCTSRPTPRRYLQLVARRKREDSDAGVRDCVDLMTAGRWVTGHSNRVIAKKHGVSPATVKNWATSASRIIRASVEPDREDIRARMVATLDTVVARAMRLKKPVYMRGDGEGVTTLMDAPDLRAAVAAIDTQARLLGLVVQKHEVSMTEDEARAKYRELTGQEWPGPAKGVC